MECGTADVMSRGERPHVGWEGGGGESSTMKPWRWRGGEARGGQRHVETARVWGGGVDGCVMKGTEVGEEDDVGFQLLSSSSVAVSTSQDFDDNATITAFFSKPMAQSLSILRVYSGLETGAPA